MRELLRPLRLYELWFALGLLHQMRSDSQYAGRPFRLEVTTFSGAVDYIRAVLPVLIGVLMWHGRLEQQALDLDYLFPYEVLGVVVLVAALFFLMLDRIAKRDRK